MSELLFFAYKCSRCPFIYTLVTLATTFSIIRFQTCKLIFEIFVGVICLRSIFYFSYQLDINYKVQTVACCLEVEGTLQTLVHVWTLTFRQLQWLLGQGTPMHCYILKIGIWDCQFWFFIIIPFLTFDTAFDVKFVDALWGVERAFFTLFCLELRGIVRSAFLDTDTREVEIYLFTYLFYLFIFW